MTVDVSEYPVFDRSLALDLLDDDEELLEEVLEVFRGSSASLLEKLEAAVTGADSEEVTKLIHTLKGASGNVCASRVQALCRALEAHCREGGEVDYQSFYDQIALELDQFWGCIDNAKA